MQKVLCIVGTRPEAIKMAPVILRLKADPDFDCKVLATAQHRELLDNVLNAFNITPDHDLNVMKPNQTLSYLTSQILKDIDDYLTQTRPDIILAQGDTTTVMASALAAFYQKIPFGHVEAGLRTKDMNNPYPEEMNRVVAGHLATWHFAPTESSKHNLLSEGISETKIFVTGNSVIDALHRVTDMSETQFTPPMPDKKMILVTAHRRENFGQPLENVFRALLTLVDQYEDIYVFYPVHPNPRVKKMAYDRLGHHERVILSDPLDYVPFVHAMKAAHLILSDSGGVQEEAPALGKPVLVLRHDTERPEALEHNVVKLVGTQYDTIIQETRRLLDSPETYKAMSRGVSPYGDGKTAERIATILKTS